MTKIYIKEVLAILELVLLFFFRSLYEDLGTLFRFPDFMLAFHFQRTLLSCQVMCPMFALATWLFNSSHSLTRLHTRLFTVAVRWYLSYTLHQKAQEFRATFNQERVFVYFEPELYDPKELDEFERVGKDGELYAILWALVGLYHFIRALYKLGLRLHKLIKSLKQGRTDSAGTEAPPPADKTAEPPPAGQPPPATGQPPPAAGKTPPPADKTAPPPPAEKAPPPPKKPAAPPTETPAAPAEKTPPPAATGKTPTPPPDKKAAPPAEKTPPPPAKGKASSPAKEEPKEKAAAEKKPTPPPAEKTPPPPPAAKTPPPPAKEKTPAPAKEKAAPSAKTQPPPPPPPAGKDPPAGKPPPAAKKK